MADQPPPPPPPPHGQSPRPPGGLPDGNYDIFIIPPHSAGSGFLYLPSLQPHRNSFIAGMAVSLVCVGLYAIVTPVLKGWLATVMAGNVTGLLLLIVIVGVGAWAFGKTSGEYSAGSWRSQGTTGGPGASHSQHNQQSQQGWGSKAHAPHPPPPPQQEAPPPPQPDAQSSWDKAKEETRRKEEARKRAEELDRRRAEAAKAREEVERAAKARAEKEKWEQARAREKEQREREARERLARDKGAGAGTPEKETREQSIRERMDRLRREREERERQKAASSPSATGRTSPRKEYVRPTAKSAIGTEDEYSYRPYDTPPPKAKTAAYHASSASSVSGLSESSYAASQTTARTTPPASMRGPYSTKDPDKIQIKAVYLFNDSFPTKPVSQLVAGQASVTDGLVLNIRTDGLFIDDDLRSVPQREWDIKAWTLKLVEDGAVKGVFVNGQGLHVLRASIRNAENSKYCFVIDGAETWKLAAGLQRLRKGPQVRSLGMSGMKESEVRGILATLGWL